MPTKSVTPKTATKPAPVKTVKKAAKPASYTKETPNIVYDKVDVKLYVEDDLLTVERAKELLGWTEEAEGSSFGANFTIIDENKKKIHCVHNDHNRPLDESTSRKYAQDMLNGHWMFNGETIIVGKCGNVISGQHRLIGLILAEQVRNGDNKAHWQKIHPEPLAIPALVVFGVSEDQEVTRTLDNVKPRTLADVLFVGGTFGAKKRQEREKLCAMLTYAIKLLWERTGAKDDAYVVGTKKYNTHAESLELLDRHKRLLKCVAHVFEEDKDGSIQKLLPLGTSSGLMYLMATSNSDGGKYRAMDYPSEKKLEFNNNDKAEEFFVMLGSRNKVIGPVVEVISDLLNTGRADTPARLTVLIKAWLLFVAGNQITVDDIMPEFQKTEDGDWYQVGWTGEVGGIDIGAQTLERDAEESEDPDEEELAARADEVQGRQTPPKSVKKAATPPVEANGKHEPAASKSIADELSELRAEYPDCIILLRDSAGVSAFGEDAEPVSTALGVPIQKASGTIHRASFALGDFDANTTKLEEAGYYWVGLERYEGEWIDYTDVPVKSTQPAKPVKKAALKKIAK